MYALCDENKIQSDYLAENICPLGMLHCAIYRLQFFVLGKLPRNNLPSPFVVRYGLFIH